MESDSEFYSSQQQGGMDQQLDIYDDLDPNNRTWKIHSAQNSYGTLSSDSPNIVMTP
ncbi:protein of unknown function [Kyrpidia spormannii]|uniref:Uncharacterized protein n=1 Tax=Kyrpidia spormannii TaxID=2055160 RepID=A0A6F9EGC9_9BACL|nr:protein of unknown function [Kyrpidia spormannii]